MGNREDYPRLKLGARVLLFLAMGLLGTSCSLIPERQASEASVLGAADDAAPASARLRPLEIPRPAPSIQPTLSWDTTEPQLRASLNKAVSAPDKTVDVDELWSLMTSEFGLDHHLTQHTVQAAVTKFTRNPEWLAKAQERMSLYLPYFLEETRRRNLPAELALLPIIESTLNPDALSPRGALGLWQFMPDTATRFGLARDWWQDSRQDTVASTQAALDYLELLHAQFGDWLLTIAAYNAGEGTIARALPQARRRDSAVSPFFHLPLSDETRNYVPQVLALAAIIKDPERYDVDLPTIASAVPFKAVKAKGPVDLELAASVLDVSPAELVALNPSLKRNITPPNGTENFLVPARLGPGAEARLNAVAGQPGSGAVVTYRVQPGDTLSGIASRFGSTVVAVRQLNGLASNAIRAHSQLQVPRVGQSTRELLAATTTAAPATSRGVTRYRVRRGDTLEKIARRFGSTVGSLRSLNGLRSSAIRADMTLAVSAPTEQLAARGPAPANAAGRSSKPSATASTSITAAYRVRAGDSLIAIAKRHGTTVSQLKLLNGLQSDRIAMNATLRVPARASLPSGVPDGQQVAGRAPVQFDQHTVRSGDTLWGIARKYDVSHQALMQANGLTSGQRLKIGRTLTIPQPVSVDVAGG